MAARLQVAGEVKYGYVIVTATVDSQRDVTRLVQLPNFHPWTATDCVRVQSACAPKCGQRSVMLMQAAVFSPDVCLRKAVTPGRACATAAAY